MDTRNSFTDIEYSLRKQTGKRGEFLKRIDPIIPWEQLVDAVQPYYPSGKRGRPAKPLEVMIRMYFLQQWFGLSAAGLEDAAYDSYAFRKFIGISFLEEQVPDADTLCRFKRLLRKHELDVNINSVVDDALKAEGMKLTAGTVAEPQLRVVRRKKER
ncbi:MAG: transposase [Clostridia bacterium]|nr:transposase [Clostridia bacterium]